MHQVTEKLGEIKKINELSSELMKAIAVKGTGKRKRGGKGHEGGEEKR
jgi:hypothetical protein